MAMFQEEVRVGGPGGNGGEKGVMGFRKRSPTPHQDLHPGLVEPSACRLCKRNRGACSQLLLENPGGEALRLAS